MAQNSSTEHAAFPPTSIQLSQLRHGSDVRADAGLASTSATRSSHIRRNPSTRTLASRFATESLRLSSSPRSVANFGIWANVASSSATVSFVQSTAGGPAPFPPILSSAPASAS